MPEELMSQRTIPAGRKDRRRHHNQPRSARKTSAQNSMDQFMVLYPNGKCRKKRCYTKGFCETMIPLDAYFSPIFCKKCKRIRHGESCPDLFQKCGICPTLRRLRLRPWFPATT